MLVNYYFSISLQIRSCIHVLSIIGRKQENTIKQGCLTMVHLVHIGTCLSILILANIISDFNNEPI